MATPAKIPAKRYPPRVQKEAYRFSDDDLASDRDFQRAMEALLSSRDVKIIGTGIQVRSPLGPFVIPCLYQKRDGNPVILVSQPQPWEASSSKNFFSYVCRLRTTSEYVSVPVVHAQENDVPPEVEFLSDEAPATLLAVDARVFYKSDTYEQEANFSAHAEDFSKILGHYTDFEIDFRADTARHLDDLIQKWYFSEGHDYPCLGALKNMLGFFYGEIFVRNLLGQWLARKCDGGFTTIWIDTGRSRYNVIGKVWKAFKYGTKEESLVKLYQSAVAGIG
jgi:hypothetical protein